MLVSEIKKTIREIPDFPKPGINFYDLSTLFLDPEAFCSTVDRMVERFEGEKIDAIAAIEARGFVLAAAMAYRMRCALIMVRKQGKLPGKTEEEAYTLEYGEARIEIHDDAARAGQNVIVVDDVLATGGTAAAAGRLLGRLGARVGGYAFLVELGFLDGRARLEPDDVFALIRYDR